MSDVMKGQRLRSDPAVLRLVTSDVPDASSIKKHELLQSLSLLVPAQVSA